MIQLYFHWEIMKLSCFCFFLFFFFLSLISTLIDCSVDVLFRNWVSLFFLCVCCSQTVDINVSISDFFLHLAQPDHDLNTHHCLCGADGELIFIYHQYYSIKHILCTEKINRVFIQYWIHWVHLIYLQVLLFAGVM